MNSGHDNERKKQAEADAQMESELWKKNIQVNMFVQTIALIIGLLWVCNIIVIIICDRVRGNRAFVEKIVLKVRYGL